MKHFFKCFKGCLCLLLNLIMLTDFNLYAQDYAEHRQEMLDRLDLSGLKAKLFLNAGALPTNWP